MIPFRVLTLALTLLLAGCAGPRAMSEMNDTRLAALPLVTHPATGPGDTLVVIYTGDGGWAAVDRGMAAGFARANMPVVGVNSLRYFATARTPEAAAVDLAAIIDHYAAAWSKSRVILVGYSFGADALPVIVPRLPAATRAKLRLFALVSMLQVGELQFHMADWFDHRGHASYPTAPAVVALKGLPMICIYGAAERDVACPSFPPDLITQVSLPGGHHYNGVYEGIVKAILAQTP
jgi:type IV secretory pathway VirJ component